MPKSEALVPDKNGGWLSGSQIKTLGVFPKGIKIDPSSSQKKDRFCTVSGKTDGVLWLLVLYNRTD